MCIKHNHLHLVIKKIHNINVGIILGVEHEVDEGIMNPSGVSNLGTNRFAIHHDTSNQKNLR
jgi:hypothetical protein